MGGSQSSQHSLQQQPQPVMTRAPRAAAAAAAVSVSTAQQNSLLPALYSPLIHKHTTRCDDAAPPPPPLPPAPPGAPPRAASPTTPDPKEVDAIAAAAASASRYTNPGPYETAAMDGKRLVTLESFDGFRCDINKQVSPYMAVVHSFWLGTSMLPDGRKSTYTFVTQVVDDRGLLMARVDPSRASIDGRIHRSILSGLAMLKVQLGITPDGQGDQLLAELDTGGQSWTASLKYGSMGGGCVYGCNYLQAITPAWHMGGEGMYVAANQALLSNYTLKYTMPAKTGDEDAPRPIATLPSKPPLPAAANPADAAGSSTMCINYNTTQSLLTMNYKRVVTPYRVVLGAELSCHPLTLESSFCAGAEFKLQRSKINVVCDTSTGGLRMVTLVEAKLGTAVSSPTIQFSADVDHVHEEMKFGYGITIDA